jgi:hypothetical protein
MAIASGTRKSLPTASKSLARGKALPRIAAAARQWSDQGSAPHYDRHFLLIIVEFSCEKSEAEKKNRKCEEG